VTAIIRDGKASGDEVLAEGWYTGRPSRKAALVRAIPDGALPVIAPKLFIA
jgi:hypothetical protein